jgi:hydroxymethylglutaryl-CoA synthase
MVGITSYGAYVPIYRMSHEEIGRAWGKKGGRGERPVAGWDEDAITLGVEAARDCLKGAGGKGIDGLYFATVTPPYSEKQSASIIAAATNLREDINTIDFAHSRRSGTNALRAAMDAVSGGSAKKTLVVTADCPLPAPDSQEEFIFGDAGAAFLIGDSEVIASVDGSYSMTSEFLDFWRLPTDRHSQSWEDRFVKDEGYLRIFPKVIVGLMKKYNMSAKDFTKVIFDAPDPRSHQRMARKLGFDPKTQVQDPMFNSLGNTGSSFASMLLVAALEESKPGDRILFASYGDGGDAFILTVTDQIEKRPENIRGITGYLDSKIYLESYGKYLRFRDLMEWEVDRRPPPRTSLPTYFRESKQLIRLLGQKCNKCGHEQFPRQRRCMWCQAKMETEGEYEDIEFAGKKGLLFSYSMDERAPVMDLPNVGCVVDLEGGARYYGLMTDRDINKIKIGMEMEFTFRRINDAQGVHNYFWKVRPVRGK